MQSLETYLLTYALNSLWQVPLIFAAAWLAARLLRRSGPTTEHRVWATALLLEALLPACSIPPGEILRRLAQLIPRSWGTHALNGDAHITVISGAGYAHGLFHLPAQLLAIVALAYGCIIAYFATRLVWGLRKTHVLRRRSQRIVLTGAAAHTWTRYSNLFAVHDAEVAVSSDASCPVTLGIRRRLLLLPAHLPPTLSDEDLDAAIAHEFATMHRRAVAKNLVYALLSLPIAYHPLLWLTRARIDETREMVCDAMAAAAVAGPQQYTRSLLRLASLLVHDSTDTTLHAIGIFDANIFERRVMNLTQNHIELRGLRRLATAAACIAIGLGTCASALALRMNVATPADTSTNQTRNPSDTSTLPSHPTLISSKPPEFPAASMAKKEKINGNVLVALIVGKDGVPKHVAIKKGLRPDFDQSAIDAVKQYRFKPALLHGNAVEYPLFIEVNFQRF